MIDRFDEFLRVKRNFAAWVLGCFVLATAYAVTIQAVSAHIAQVAAARERAHAAAVEAAQRKAAWQAHLRRLAWDRAHPEIIAERKAEARARAKAAASAQAARDAAQRAQAARDAAARQAEQEREDKLAHACETALDYEKQAAKDDTAGSYQDAYDNATHGLEYNDSCQDDTQQMINKGYLLSMKGFAEHYLSVGDSRTDLNQANQLLVECQTTPGVYGTSTAAQCETQEDNNISSQTNWDTESDNSGA